MSDWVPPGRRGGRRRAQIRVVLYDHERDAMEAEADRLGMSLSDLVRVRCLGPVRCAKCGRE